MLSIRTILHPNDFSTQAIHALRLACSLAKDHRAKLILLHVVVPTDDPWFKEDLNELRVKLAQLPVPAGAEPVERELTQGLVTEEILRVAKEKQCDLIVMGTHGRTGLRRALLGSVAEHVVRRASCPVLTLKLPFDPPA